jgi:hypothetical protein
MYLRSNCYNDSNQLLTLASRAAKKTAPGVIGHVSMYPF